MDEKNNLPEWFNDLVTQYQAGISREFILFGNIADLIRNPDDEPEKQYISFREFWEKIFEEREMVILYSMAWGLRFPNKDMEERFRIASGFDQPDSSSTSPLAKVGVLQKRRLPQDPETCLLLIERALRNIPKIAVMIYFAHHVVPAGGPGGTTQTPSERVNIERLAQWASSVGIKESKGIVLLFTDKIANLASELRETNSGVKPIMVLKPSRAERKEFLQSITCKPQPKKKKQPPVDSEGKFLVPEDFNLDEFTHATQGMGFQQILDIFLRSKERKGAVNLDYVKEEKKKILNSEFGEVMEVMEPASGFDDVGGLEYIKKYFNVILDAIKKGEKRLVPMGITLMGPPGTGKTKILEALAFEAGFNFVKAKNLRNMWVGGSEERMQTFKYGLYSLAPVVVNNDEADLAEADRNSPKGDSGVSERHMREWMDMLSDPKIRGQIIVINCTNRPDRLDPALKRSGRSDDRVLLPMPSEEERKVIFPVMFKRYKIPTSISDFTEFAELTNGLSGADIEKITLNAFKLAFKQCREKVDADDLKKAIADFIPSASQKEIDLMTLMGILESSSRELLPPHIKEIVEAIKKRNMVPNLDGILAEIKARKIVDID
ncbi:MAG: ATP-binding protein [Candidatus Nealsonbacteria bacterium]|nr:ATP-binding protein [Candidatus Nealsonbacteria bacterium]